MLTSSAIGVCVCPTSRISCKLFLPGCIWFLPSYFQLVSNIQPKVLTPHRVQKQCEVQEFLWNIACTWNLVSVCHEYKNNLEPWPPNYADCKSKNLLKYLSKVETTQGTIWEISQQKLATRRVYDVLVSTYCFWNVIGIQIKAHRIIFSKVTSRITLRQTGGIHWWRLPLCYTFAADLHFLLFCVVIYVCRTSRVTVQLPGHHFLRAVRWIC